ncbi:hypothetical protein ACIHFD_49290 [Nonomuraea sp. NPDC051941]|uniref:hypothetical protein n=1 Tax=Nonomuraea sp. NPDC051941 TaxID=3364373 RepID=UPI0037C5B426
MARFWKARGDGESSTPPAEAVHVNGQHGTVEARDGDWVTVQLADGAITNVLASRAPKCTCAGGGSK